MREQQPAVSDQGSPPPTTPRGAAPLFGPPERDPWLGLGLILLSAVGTVTIVAAALLFGWRVGLVAFGAHVGLLGLFLRWEMRRRHARRHADAIARRRRRSAVTEPNSL